MVCKDCAAGRALLGGALIALVALAGCASTNGDDAASASMVTADEALLAPPPARATGRAPRFPNLAETRRTAAPQFTDAERASSAANLRQRRQAMAATVSDPIRDQAAFLREIGRTHGDETLRAIEAR